MTELIPNIKIGRTAASLIITNDQKQVLWCKRGEQAPFLGSYWAFVGGMVNETDMQSSDDPTIILKVTALREAIEELDLNLSVDDVDLDQVEWLGSWQTHPYLPKEIECVFFKIHACHLNLDRGLAITLQKDGELEDVCWKCAELFYEQWCKGEVTLAPPTLAFCKALASNKPLSQASSLYPELHTINQVIPSIQLLPLRSATLPPATHTNTYFIGEKTFYIVDPGTTKASELDKLYASVDTRLAQGDHFSGIILTHHHQDHCSGLLELSSKYPKPVFMHPLTAQLLKMSDFNPLLEGNTLTWQSYNNQKDYVEIWHTPGHAPGHICLIHHASESAVVGDMVAGVGSIIIEPDDGDMAVYIQNLERLKRRGFNRLLPSHGPPIANTKHLLRTYIEHRLNREKKVYQALPKSLPITQKGGEIKWITLADIVDSAYDDAPDMVKKGPYGGLAGQAALSHLISLEKQGEAICSDTIPSSKSRWIAHQPYLDRFAHSLTRLKVMMSTLRVQCPWDKKQTLDSLKRYLIEESYEVLDSMSDAPEHREELGDLFFQILFQSVIREQDGQFDLADVFDSLANKLSRRHPHVFGDLKVDDAGEVKGIWQAIKAQERKAKKQGKHKSSQSLLSGIPKSAPALLRAQMIGEKAATVGFEWPSVTGALAKVEEERHEVIEAIESGDQAQILAELGDLFFAVVNVCRHLHVDPQMALESTNQTFSKRFQRVEYLASERNLDLKEMHIDDLEALWQEAKRFFKT